MKRCREANAQGKALPVHATNHLHAPALFTNGVKGSRYPPNIRVDGSYNRLNTEERRKSFALVGNQTAINWPPARSPIFLAPSDAGYTNVCLSRLVYGGTVPKVVFSSSRI